MNQCEIYVGNFPYETQKEDLQKLFEQYGTISEVKLIMDFETNKSKGFGFITFSSKEECELAVKEANGLDVGGRKLRVNLAKSKSERSAGGRGGRDRGGNGGNRSRW